MHVRPPLLVYICLYNDQDFEPAYSAGMHCTVMQAVRLGIDVHTN